MRRSLASIVFVFVALAAITLSAAPPTVDSCTNLANNSALKSLANTTIDSATMVSGAFSAPGAGGQPIQGLPALCRVALTQKPSAISDIKIEVWLPMDGWNQKLQAVGNGGLAGTISYAALATAVKAGYASVSTDTGHVVTDNAWLPMDEEERDYGYRSIHGMTIAAKTIVQGFYGSAAKRSYFNGCSTGGGQAFGEAQLYPQDYDGLLAGAPQDYPTHLRLADIWQFQIVNNEPANNLPKATLSMVTASVLKQCGGDDATKDGFLGNPQTCHFEPEQLMCKQGQDPASCLTSPQIETLKKVYAGYIDSRTKKQVWPGLMVGSEAPAGQGLLGWQASGLNGPAPFAGAGQFYTLGVLEDPNADYHKIDTGAALDMAEKKFSYLDHVSTNIDAFTKHGGKFLIYHGWADPLVTPANSVDYYGSLVENAEHKKHLDQTAAIAETQKSVRLFMVPGMGHCNGGPGATNFDAMPALDKWVDGGAAPEKIVAGHLMNGSTTFSRPLCPYPQAAQYSGSGDRADASNWTCAAQPFAYDPAFYKNTSKK